MPNPTPSALHVDSLLTDISVAFIQSSTKYVANRVFPTVPVAKKSDLFATYSTADFLRDEFEERHAGDEAVTIGYRTGTDNYVATEWAAQHAIDDQVRANADSPFRPEQDAVEMLTQKLMIKREVEWVTNFFSTGDIWTGSSDGADLVGGTDFTQWSNAASTPIEDVHSQMARIESNTGFLPNKLVVNRDVWFDLKNHPDIVDRIKHTSRDAVTTDLVARLLGIDEVLITAAVRNTRGEGLDHSGSYVGSDEALLVYAAPSPTLLAPSGGYTFQWTGLLPGANQGMAVERYRQEERVSDVVRLRAAWDQKVVSSALGVLFSDASTNA